MRRPADIELPQGWNWERVEAARAKWGVDEDMVPIATCNGVVAWGTINSVRAERRAVQNYISEGLGEV